MALSGRSWEWKDRDCAACGRKPLGPALRKRWGCDGPTTDVLFVDGKPVDRCPLALFREHPREAEIAGWAARAFGAHEHGNMAWFMGRAKMSFRGEQAFALWSRHYNEQWRRTDGAG